MKNTLLRCAIRAPLLTPALSKARVRKLGLASFVHPNLADRAPMSGSLPLARVAAHISLTFLFSWKENELMNGWA